MAVTKEAVVAVLSGLIDPNTRKDFVSSRSAKNIVVEGDKVALDVELGYPAKTQIELIRNQVGTALQAIPGVGSVDEITARALAALS